MRKGVQDREHTGPRDLAFYSEGHRESLEASEQSLQRAAPMERTDYKESRSQRQREGYGLHQRE